MILALNEIVGFAAFLMIHVYRFSYSGKLCSCDIRERCYEDSVTVGEMDLEHPWTSDGYLIERGKFLLGLVIFFWFSLALCCFVNFSSFIVFKPKE